MLVLTLLEETKQAGFAEKFFSISVFECVSRSSAPQEIDRRWHEC